MIKLRDFFSTYVYERMNQWSKTIFIFNQFKKQWIRSIILLKGTVISSMQAGVWDICKYFFAKITITIVVWEIKYKLYFTIKHNFNATCPVNWKDKYIKNIGYLYTCILIVNLYQIVPSNIDYLVILEIIFFSSTCFT